MKIYDEMKIRELTESEVNLEMGYLKADKHVIYHEAVPAVTIETQIAELQAQGISIMEKDGKSYQINEGYENGSKEVAEIKEIPAKDAWEEYEDIQVYVPYTAKEIEERNLANLRSRRQIECFPIINRGQLWYDTLTVVQKMELKDWYNAWLNVTETNVIPTKPTWLT